MTRGWSRPARQSRVLGTAERIHVLRLAPRPDCLPRRPGSGALWSSAALQQRCCWPFSPRGPRWPGVCDLSRSLRCRLSGLRRWSRLHRRRPCPARSPPSRPIQLTRIPPPPLRSRRPLVPHRSLKFHRSLEVAHPAIRPRCPDPIRRCRPATPESRAHPHQPRIPSAQSRYHHGSCGITLPPASWRCAAAPWSRRRCALSSLPRHRQQRTPVLVRRGRIGLDADAGLAHDVVGQPRPVP